MRPIVGESKEKYLCIKFLKMTMPLFMLAKILLQSTIRVYCYLLKEKVKQLYLQVIITIGRSLTMYIWSWMLQ